MSSLPATPLWLCGCAFLAGFVDSMVGGGGLIQLPALLLFLPPEQAAVVPAVLGTNKLSSICGTGMALAQYARRIAIPWRSMYPAAIAAFVFSFLGARTVSILSTAILKPLVLVLLVVVAIYTFIRKDFGGLHAPRFTARHETWIGLLIGVVIGFYDGFFGPGTGSFLIFTFIGVLGFDFLTATASAKVINFATNLSAVAYFAATDRILYAYAVPMGICNVLGSVLGTRLAMWKGNRFVRWLFLLVVSALIARYGWEVLSG
jgi:uncharacterized membrane protein YfcA